MTPGPDSPSRLDAVQNAVLPTALRILSRVNVWAYRRSHGRIGGTWRLGSAARKPVPILLLDHVGRRSGQRFTTPLIYLPDGDRFLVVASQGGLPKNPQWFNNLLAAPRTTVQVGAEIIEVTARAASPEERSSLWPRVVEHYADFGSYQARTEREIPVVVLERVGAGGRTNS